MLSSRQVALIQLSVEQAVEELSAQIGRRAAALVQKGIQRREADEEGLTRVITPTFEKLVRSYRPATGGPSLPNLHLVRNMRFINAVTKHVTGHLDSKDGCVRMVMFVKSIDNDECWMVSFHNSAMNASCRRCGSMGHMEPSCSSPPVRLSSADVAALVPVKNDCILTDTDGGMSMVVDLTGHPYNPNVLGGCITCLEGDY